MKGTKGIGKGSLSLSSKNNLPDLFDDIDNINFRLEKNGEIVQKSNSSNMIWKIDQLISKASTFFTIKIGDIMFTGTPEGVGKVVENDLLEGYIDDKKVFSVRVK